MGSLLSCIRTPHQGAECNPGACYKYLGIQEREIEGLAGEKEGCNDDVEYITVQRQADFHELGKSIDSKEILASISDTNVPLGHIGEIAMKWVKVSEPALPSLSHTTLSSTLLL